MTRIPRAGRWLAMSILCVATAAPAEARERPVGGPPARLSGSAAAAEPLLRGPHTR